MCPEGLQNHLNLNQSKLVDYLDMREEIMSYLETKHVNADTRGTPMDLGSVGKHGKDSGKCCSICGKTNHKIHEC